MAFDLIVRNGKVFDGTGSPPIDADVGIVGDRITNVGDLSNADGAILDVGGQAVSPGFIDLHTHSDNSFLIDPLADSKVRQGSNPGTHGQLRHELLRSDHGKISR